MGGGDEIPFEEGQNVKRAKGGAGGTWDYLEGTKREFRRGEDGR